MIVDVNKVLIYGAKEEMDRFFTLAQRAGFLEFIGIWHKKALELPQEIKNMLLAVKTLRFWNSSESGFRIQVPESVAEMAQKVVHLHAALEKQFEEERILNAEIARIAPFGNFSKEEIEEIERDGRRVLQFFCMKSDLAHDIVLPPEVIYIDTEYDLDYYVAINHERVQYPKMIEVPIEKPVGKLRDLLFEVKERIGLYEAQLRSWAQHLPELQEGLIEALNAHHLESAKYDASYPLQESLFAIEAWVPVNKMKALEGLLSGLSVFFEKIAIEPMDRVPTCLDNRGSAKIGEDLVQVYDTPAPTDKDPSLWIITFFSLFFAMIIADAGYGLLYLILGLFLRWKCKNLSSSVKRVAKLVLTLGITTMLWGVLTASFFGIEIGADNPYRKLSLLHYMAMRKAAYLMEVKNDVYQEYVHNFPAVATASDGHDFLVKAAHTQEGKTKYIALEAFYDNILMEFALMVGILHISCAFGRSLRKNWTGVGWILFMVGGYFYFPTSVLEATSLFEFMGWISISFASMFGEILLYGGISLAVLAALIQQGIKGGLLEIMNAIQVFSDVLSYLRLYALGLAGMIVAATFNDLGSQFPWFIGVFIILIGHSVNITLSVMSGVIHGLRLNFLEWYRYCFDGGGKIFNPLRLKRTKP